MVVDIEGTQHMLEFWQRPHTFGRNSFRDTQGPNLILAGPMCWTLRHSWPFCGRKFRMDVDVSTLEWRITRAHTQEWHNKNVPWMAVDKIFNLSVSEQQSFNGLILKWIMGGALLIDAECVFFRLAVVIMKKHSSRTERKLTFNNTNENNPAHALSPIPFM